MGVIKRQAIQSTIFSYGGVLFGFMNSAILMPLLLTTEQVGMLSFLNSYTNLFATLCTLGIPLIILRIFPHMKQNAQKREFSSFVIFTTIMGLVLGLVFFLTFNDQILSDKNEAKTYAPFFYAFIVVFILKLSFKNFDSYTRMLLNTVLGAFSENFLLKLFILVSLSIYWLVGGFNFLYLFVLYAFGLALPGIVSTLYLLVKGEFSVSDWNLNKVILSLPKGVFQVGLFGLIGTVGNIIVLEIDRFMVSNMLGLSQNGIYTVAFFFGVFVNIPSRGIKRIASVVVSDAWKNNDTDTIEDIYNKSCLNQFLIGTYLFLGIWLNVDYVLHFLPESYMQGKYVILIIGLAQLTDMFTGVNAEIISTSKYYRFNTLFVLTLMVLVVGFNYWLIPIYGIEGAAIASALAMVVVNVFRYMFLYFAFGFQPISRKFIYILIFGVISYLSLFMTQTWFANPIAGILVTGTALTAIYWVPLYLLKVSPDVNGTINNLSKKFFN